MPKVQETEIRIPEINQTSLKIAVVGTRPIICNRMSEKARHELFLPGGRKTTAEKAANLKHDPFTEFRASPYTLSDESAPTLLAVMASAFKSAMCTAALDLPGAKKAQIGRLVWVEGDYVPIYGEPRLLVSVVRSADINHTPDIRTRVIIPRWACQLDVSFVQPLLRAQGIVNLLVAAGRTAGIGDWRPEKGKGSYGQFVIVNDDDPEFSEILRAGRAVQKAAMTAPQCYDSESAEMLAWYTSEVERRGFVTSESVAEEEEDQETNG